ncbi:hypothetical protein M426DRAFT_237147 [Hypoxylon sp. CI-4A]|nr:hypothetical protein M426DRAFT_237147 [Hypoxylon sp. CI-4A]
MSLSLQQPNTSAARSRSLRVPAKTALTAPQLTPATVSSTQIPSSTSNVALFLTNLRLLDLDLEPDWPGLSPATFSAKDAAAGQKKRIQCVEWALYQLFTIWDYDDAQNKLRPFYPPLDQIQSTNLRAALLRGLEQAKKNGVLGRDAVIRKTMLDECKGERLEEVLAVFSSAVLKKLVAERALNSGPEYRPTISENISLQNYGYTGDRVEINGLLLAHKASLRSGLERKNAARAKYRDFEELLALKERGIIRRKEQAKAESEQSAIKVSDRTKRDVGKIIRTNWTGNDQWIDSLLLNDTQPQKGGLLGSRFDEVWEGVQEGRISDLEDQNTGLLEQLDNRVRLQQDRLEKWDEFRRKMFGDMPPPPTDEAKEKNKSKGVGLSFTAHQQLRTGQIDTKAHVFPKNPPLEYASMLKSMRIELGSIGKPKIPDFSNLLGGRSKGSVVAPASEVQQPEVTIDPISDIDEWEDDVEANPRPIGKPAQPSTRNRYRLAPPSKSQFGRAQKTPPVVPPRIRYEAPRSLSPEDETPEPALSPEPPIMDELPAKEESIEFIEPISVSASSSSAFRDISPTETFHPSQVTEPISPVTRPVSPTQAMADEILASMSNASPSPMKRHRHTLSLAERTRMSMSRTISYEKEDDTLQMSPSKPSPAKSNTFSVRSPSPEKGEEYEDLLARTRRSMVGLEAAQQRARLERRRSQRESSKLVPRKDSYFPKLDEESMADASIIEELIEGDQDYDTVFKSRPRVQTSPLPSPSKTWVEE